MHTPDVRLQWKRLTDSCKGPQKAHADDGAWDLFADCPDGIELGTGETKVIQTGIAIMPPSGWHCDLRGRSGMNSKGKFVILGLIDSYYTGPWGVVLHNGTKDTIKINHHDKIAQFTVSRTYDSALQEVTEFSETGDRMGAGLGSTGQ